MIFLRRTRHLASSVTLLVGIAASQQILQSRQAAAIEQQDEATNEARGSAEPQQPAAPTTVTLEGPVTVVNQPDPNQEQREAEQRAQTQFENGIDIITLMLVGVASIGAIGAYLANLRSAKAAEEQITLLKGQIAASETSAIEQQRLAAQALVETRKSANAAKQSADVAREAIILTHRPKITLRNVDLPNIAYGNYTGGRVWATNIGDSPAFVFKFDVQWFVGDQLPMRSPYARVGATKTYRKTIPPGSSRYFTLPDIVFPNDNELEWHTAIHQDTKIVGGASLFLIGVLKYRDSLKNLRRTAFCRRYNRQTGRFEPVYDPDYEHAD